MVFVGTREYKYGRMLMSHMAADTLDELHAMAKMIGVNTKHFQDKEGRPHYDICKEKKTLAIMNGATLINDREIIKMYKEHEKNIKK